MNKLLLKFLMLSSITIVSCVSAFASWVQWGGNGHWYSFHATGGPVTWQDANAAAQSEGGYLATLTSAEENSFGYSLVSHWSLAPGHPDGWGGPWLGGFKKDGQWGAWVTGEAWSFTDWNSSLNNQEPNNVGGHEDFLMLVNKNQGVNSVGTWNDFVAEGDNRPIGGELYVDSYLIERDTQPVPEPGCLAAVGLVAALTRYFRRTP
ncbi:MAG: hypothetical protein JSS65_06430 [Armatimonadetes bacterium]|nr:hypothetical protein [Armatimonadota bacterium]